MQDIFITKIKINEVRNIKDFEINLSDNERKHLIITGKNGSGKTSLLENLKNRLNTSLIHLNKNSEIYLNYKSEFIQEHPLAKSFASGKFIIKFFSARRSSQFLETKGVNKIEFKKQYKVDESAGNDFTQHLVNLQFDKLVAKDENNLEGVKTIDGWFGVFEKELGTLFSEPKLKLVFDRKNYKYQIIENGNPPIDFNGLPDGYSAVLDVIAELMMRMEEHKTKSYDVQGIVLIDEIETHLHVDLQKKILPFLTSFFPKIQFIVTTHSPFVLSSIKNSVICDLENRIVTEDLSGYSYDTIVESYFDSNNYSDEFTNKINEYETLMDKDDLSDIERDKLLDLEIYLESIPKYWAKEFAAKYQQIKLKNIGKRK